MDNREKNNRFLYKIITPPPTFVQDMTESKRKVMQEHATYWKGLIGDGIAIVFGLVLDPRGPWGVGITDVANESDRSFHFTEGVENLPE
jgi:hypothetical protein